MLHLVADVGGTNCRMALVDAQGVRAETMRSFRNAEHAGFADVAAAFLAGGPAVRTAAVAIAGPVGAGTAQLTNCDWSFDANALAEALSLEAVHLLNDLAALGHAICVLPETAVTHLCGTPAPEATQAVVVGLGTGFNISLAHRNSPVVLTSEMGHTRLPQSVAQILEAVIGDSAAFPTTEHLFSGRGLAALHAERTGVRCAPEAVAGAPGGAETMALMARALGAQTREIAYLYMPEGGIYFNGSLARPLLQDPYRADVLGALLGDTAFDGRMARMPQYLLTEDTSALHGCARALAVGAL